MYMNVSSHFLRSSELNKVNMDTHARALHGMPSSLFRAGRLSRLHAENQGKGSPVCCGETTVFTRQNLRKLWRFKMGNTALKKNRLRRFLAPLAHQWKATRRDVAPMVANFCSYTDVF